MKKILLILVLSVILLAGCANEVVDTPVESNEVSIKNFAFAPPTLAVKTGTTITWTNEDSAPHTATSEGNFDSGTLSKGESFSYTFNTTGIFNYICTIHPSMKGAIIVED